MENVPRLSRSVAGRAAFITGAASGIGRACAFIFAREGVRVALTDINTDALASVCASISREGGEARAYAADLANADGIARAVYQAGTDFGGLDFVLNNAGIAGSVSLDDEAYDESWQRHVDILLTAHQRVIRAALPYLRTSNSARIVNVASTEAFGATVRNSPYVAAKHGVAGLTRALAIDLGKEGITVNCVCPGPVLTGMTARIPAEQRNLFANRRTALRRYAEPAEVAHMILSLCLPAASFVTGAVIPVDGGLTARNA